MSWCPGVPNRWYGCTIGWVSSKSIMSSLGWLKVTTVVLLRYRRIQSITERSNTLISGTTIFANYYRMEYDHDCKYFVKNNVIMELYYSNRSPPSPLTTSLTYSQSPFPATTITAYLLPLISIESEKFLRVRSWGSVEWWPEPVSNLNLGLQCRFVHCKFTYRYPVHVFY